MNIGLAIRKIRREREIRQDALAKDASITQTYLSQIENGKKNPTLDKLNSLAIALGIPLAVIFWNGMDENDIHPDKLTAFRTLKPSVDALINQFFNQTL